MLGVVLSGGQSSRMGSDKGLLKLEARTWAQTAMDKLAALQLPVVVSVNALQYDQYATVFSAEQLVKDNDKLDIHGPLAGVLSVHLQFPTKDLFVFACDMPLMEVEVMQEVLTLHKETKGTGDAYFFTNQEEPEPLCAIYTADGLSQIMRLHAEQQLVRHSMKFMIRHMACAILPIPPGKEYCFRNFNAHAALNGL